MNADTDAGYCRYAGHKNDTELACVHQVFLFEKHLRHHIDDFLDCNETKDEADQGSVDDKEQTHEDYSLYLRQKNDRRKQNAANAK